MLGQVVAAQFDLERAIGELTRSGASAALAESQLHVLGQLQKRIGTAGVAALAGLRGEIVGAVAQAQALVQQGQLASTSAHAAEGETLATASGAARATVQSFLHDFYERKIFDRYLRFDSKQDEAAYREREEAYRKAIDAALAKGTPEGDLEAARLARNQLSDAGVHGADASPEYGARMQRFDRRIAELEKAMERSASSAREPSQGPGRQGEQDSATPASAAVLADVLATLKSIGMSGPVAADQSGHGLTAVAAANGSERGGRV